MSAKAAGRPSDRLNPKTVDPFSSRTSKSSFSSAYTNGLIPCRLVHGSVKHKLMWTIPPEQVQFDTVIVALAEGLQESVHPYNFIAQNGFQQLLQINDARVKIIGVLPKVIQPLRAALGSSKNSVVEVGLSAVSQLSAVAESHLNAHLKQLLVPIARLVQNKTLQTTVTTLLQSLEFNCGPDALAIIKQRIPTYTSVLA